MPPKLNKVIRLDSIPLESTHFTPEGYLIDRPIVTSVGIFEYNNSDGTVRRELRLPEEVFAEESLASYQGKPVIITHDAGYVSKDNVQDENIGTILSKGYQDGDNVRAKIVIHNTDAMKECGLRELSLGYNLDIEETPGEWNGQRYDAIQRNIRVNHLALVQEARAGDQARLNIDGRDNKILKGGKCMKGTKEGAATKPAKRNDGVLSSEELKKAIEAYKKRRDNRLAAKADDGEPAPDSTAAASKANSAGTANADNAPTAKEDVKGAANTDTEEPIDTSNAEEAVQIIKDRRDRRDEMGDPETIEEANGIIAKQDEDMDYLYDIIDSLLAERDFNAAAKSDSDDETPIADPTAKENEDGDDIPDKPVPKEDIDGNIVNDDGEEDEPVVPAKAEPSKTMNSDSVDATVRQRLKVVKVGSALGLDGLEDMDIVKAKKTVIKAVVPDARLDGKDTAYIDGYFNALAKAVKERSVKDTSYQKRQMFNADGRGSIGAASANSARSARERMIARHRNSNKEVK